MTGVTLVLHSILNEFILSSFIDVFSDRLDGQLVSFDRFNPCRISMLEVIAAALLPCVKHHRLKKQRRPFSAEVVIDAKKNRTDRNTSWKIVACNDSVGFLEPPSPFENVFARHGRLSIEFVLRAAIHCLHPQ
jgi:hypothetical protein